MAGEWYDMIVVGGGPAGATVAGLLAKRGMRVAVCEGKKFPREKVCGEFVGTRVRAVLAELGLLEEFDRRAGPEIQRVMVCAGESEAIGTMPIGEGGAYPRAMGRGDFDAMLLERARELGARVAEGCHVRRVEGDERTGFRVVTAEGELRGRAVVLAHGRAAGLNADRKLRREYVSFKAHLGGARLDEQTIAICGAAGIYAGLVKTSGERFVTAFVVRRDRLARFGNSGDAQFASLLREVPEFRRMLSGAQRLGPWLASGPLEPGVRNLYQAGRFFAPRGARWLVSSQWSVVSSWVLGPLVSSSCAGPPLTKG